MFSQAAAGGSALLRDAAIAAAYELGVIDALGRGSQSVEALAAELGITAGARRLRALVDALVALGVVARERDRVVLASRPASPTVPREGWGRIADVVRTDRALPAPTGELAVRYHRHLLDAGAAAARELAGVLAQYGARDLVDLGGGAGAYTAAFLDRVAVARATLIDAPEVIALAAETLARFGDRVTLIAGDGRTVQVGGAHDATLLANVLHLHAPSACAALCHAAAAMIRPGGMVAIVDLHIDADRAGPLEAALFALNMAIYTDGGDVYPTAQLAAWLAGAGLVGIEAHRLAAAPDAEVVLGFAPRGARAAFVEVTGLAEPAAVIAGELAVALAEEGPELALPQPLETVLSHALALERREGGDPERAAQLVRHYTVLMPAQRRSQLDASATDATALLHARLDWRRLPRLRTALARLFAVVRGAGDEPTADARATRALGAGDVNAFCARTSTVAELFTRTHYGRAMPLLYGNLADLAYFAASGGLDTQATIDRYLTTPIIHELCHFAPERDALQPLHLDECVAGWLGVYVHPEFAYPAEGFDDAIYAAPWLAQVGQAIARAFGVAPVIRAHAGDQAWDAAVPRAFVDTAARLGWDDWRARRSLHFLADSLDPAPWVALALLAGSGRSLAGASLASLARTPLVELADTLPVDPAFDRVIVEDALRAMCLDNVRIEGSFRARAQVVAPIAIDARAACVTTGPRNELDVVPPRYWLPPHVAARLVSTGSAGYELRLRALSAIPEVADAVCAASPGREGPSFALRPI